MKKALAILMAALLTFGCFGGALAGEGTRDEYSGWVGPTVEWTLSGGRLTIFGEGAMEENTAYNYFWAPWYNYRDQITSISIESGVTTISAYAFFEVTHVTSVTIPSTVESIGINAFCGCDSLMYIYGSGTYGSVNGVLFTDGGTTLAFYPPARTGEYTVPSGTTKIERNAFMRCGVTKVNLPEGLTTIGSAAFMSCQQMEEVNLPETLTSIGWEAFYNCTSLTEVTIPAAVNDVGSMAFEYCSELQYATFNGDAPESFGYSVFYGCKSGFKIRYYYEYHSTWDPDENNMWYSGSEWYNLSPVYPVSGACGDNISWTWNEGTKTLAFTGTGDMPDFPNGTPYGCYRSEAEHLVIGEGITGISAEAFNGFSAIEELVLPEGLTSVGEWAFCDCCSLRTVVIPASIQRIDSNAFAWNYYLKSAVFNGEPPASFGEDVFSCAANTFYIGYYSAYENEWAPNGEMFWNGYFIKPVDTDSPYGICGDGLMWSFDPATGTLTVSGEGTMFYFDPEEQPWAEVAGNITSVVLEEGVASVGSYAFYGLPALASVSLPSTLQSIENAAFGYCPSLTSITVSPDNEYYYVEDGVLFSLCDSGGEILQKDGDDDEGDEEEEEFDYLAVYPGGRMGAYTVPDHVGTISACAFMGCAKLTAISFGDNLHYIGAHAFEGCTGLTQLDFPPELWEFGQMAFAYCSGLTSVTVPASVSWQGSMTFAWCDGLESVEFEEGVDYVGYGMFTECTSLTDITFPSTLYGLGDETFAGCTALTEVTFPEGLEELDYYTFENCSSLSRAIFLGPTPEYIGYAVFEGCAPDFCMYYTAEYVESWSPNGETEWHDYPIALLGDEPPAIEYGDVDGNGTIDMSDISALFSFLSGGSMQLSPEALLAADANGDGTVNVMDITAIFNMIANS